VLYAAASYLYRALEADSKLYTLSELSSGCVEAMVNRYTANLPLLCCAAVLIGSKMFDVEAVRSDMLCKLFPGSFSTQDVNIMERGLLGVLNWEVNVVTPSDFLEALKRFVDEPASELCSQRVPNEIWDVAEDCCAALLGTNPAAGKGASELAISSLCWAFDSNQMDTGPLRRLIAELEIAEPGADCWGAMQSPGGAKSDAVHHVEEYRSPSANSDSCFSSATTQDPEDTGSSEADESHETELICV
jgi:hypothetical protein